MAENNCKCIVCGKEYYFCLSCNKRSAHPEPSWRVNYCGENCKNISTVLTSYGFGNITKEEAEEALGKLDLTGLKSFSKNVRDEIANIQKKDKLAKPSFSEKRENSSKGLTDSVEESKGLMEPSKEEKGTE